MMTEQYRKELEQAEREREARIAALMKEGYNRKGAEVEEARRSDLLLQAQLDTLLPDGTKRRSNMPTPPRSAFPKLGKLRLGSYKQR